MDFSTGPDASAFRAEVREFLREHLTAAVHERMHDTGTMHDWGLHLGLAERGWIGAGWSAEEGGQGHSAFMVDALYQELAAAGAPTDGFSATMCIAETLRRIGTSFHREQIIKPILEGRLLIAMGYSEPGAGSDLISVRTSARRDGDMWVIDGQKAFTTLAHEAGYVLALTRTDPDVAPRNGLTVFLIPTDSPDFSLAPVATLGGERTNMTYYSEVRVSDEMRVGEIGGGWDVLSLALSFERGGEFAAQLRRLLDDSISWVRTNSDADAADAARVGRLAADAEVARVLGLRAAWSRDLPGAGAVEGVMAKVFATNRLLAAAGDVLDMLGSAGQVTDGVEIPGAQGIEHTYRHAQVTTIYGGTTEVLLGVIAEKRMGLPRSRAARGAPAPAAAER